MESRIDEDPHHHKQTNSRHGSLGEDGRTIEVVGIHVEITVGIEKRKTEHHHNSARNYINPQTRITRRLRTFLLREQYPTGDQPHYWVKKEKLCIQSDNLLYEVDQVEEIREGFLKGHPYETYTYLVILRILLQSKGKEIDTLFLVVNLHSSSESKTFFSHLGN